MGNCMKWKRMQAESTESFLTCYFRSTKGLNCWGTTTNRQRHGCRTGWNASSLCTRWPKQGLMENSRCGFCVDAEHVQMPWAEPLRLLHVKTCTKRDIPTPASSHHHSDGDRTLCRHCAARCETSTSLCVLGSTMSKSMSVTISQSFLKLLEKCLAERIRKSYEDIFSN